jgi:hypothetical protein
MWACIPCSTGLTMSAKLVISRLICENEHSHVRGFLQSGIISAAMAVKSLPSQH